MQCANLVAKVVEHFLKALTSEWRLVHTSGTAMNNAGLNEENWHSLEGERQIVISPSSKNETYAAPYWIDIEGTPELRFLGTEITPGIYAVYFPQKGSSKDWLSSLKKRNG